MSHALFAGSFDPPTMGHMDLIERASRLFRHVTVAVMINAAKTPMFTAEERVDMLKECVSRLDNVTVTAGAGLTLDLAKAVGADVLLRGIRGEGDAGMEAALAAGNRHVGNIDTLALFTAPQYGFISSTLVRDVIRHGGRLDGLVPPCLIERLTGQIQQRCL